MTVPTSSSWMPVLNCSICCLRIPAISSAFIIRLLSLRYVGQLACESVETAGDRRIDSAVPHHEAQTSDKARIDYVGNLELLCVQLFQPRHELLALGWIEGTRRFERQLFDAARFAFQREVFGDDRAQKGFAALADQQQHRVHRDRVNLSIERLREHPFLRGAIDNRRFKELVDAPRRVDHTADSL